jgi:hypothetical protein
MRRLPRIFLEGSFPDVMSGYRDDGEIPVSKVGLGDREQRSIEDHGVLLLDGWGVGKKRDDSPSAEDIYAILCPSSSIFVCYDSWKASTTLS